MCFLWIKPPLHSAPDKQLTILTYNVLADPWKTEQRIPALFAALETSDADVIALQEVAPWFAQRLQREPWLANYHFPTDDNGQIAIAREFLILTKSEPLSRQTLKLPTQQGRIAFLTTIPFADSTLTIATCHLDSLLEDGPIRAQQLDTLFAALESSPHAILLGDLNFGANEQPDTAAIPQTYLDPWLILHPSKPGFTWDRKLNRKARADSFPGEPSRRLDRILFRSKNIRPAHVSLFANQAISQKKPQFFPSDHFGVITTFDLQNEITTPLQHPKPPQKKYP